MHHTRLLQTAGALLFLRFDLGEDTIGKVQRKISGPPAAAQRFSSVF
jgi:hypothetical protein